MGLLKSFILIFIVLCAIMGARIYKQVFGPMPKPEMDVEAYWGPGDKPSHKEDTSIRSFKVSYSEEVISTLKDQLENFPELHAPLEGVNFEYGFNSKYLKQVVKYWKNDYLSNWESRQTYLNKYPHFKTKIQGLDMHFIHVKPNKPSGRPVLPLLLIHGWPGSVVVFYSLIENLMTNDKYDFEIVVPSLPGYGWSEASAKKDLGHIEISVIMRNLMIRLGYQKFYIQGGDWGSFVGSDLATLFPENVLGYHSNLCGSRTPAYSVKTFIASFYPQYFIPKEYVHFVFPFLKKVPDLLVESGYIHIQATKPDTIGTALTNDPIGLAAYILEKFSTWTNKDYRKLPDGGLTKRFTMDALLDNVMIYYLTNSITTSQRLFSETFSFREFALNIDRVPTAVPTGCARFFNDIVHTFDWVLKDKYSNLVQSTWYEEGGHFAAMEVPNVMYKDLMEFIAKTQKSGKVNSEL